LYELQDEWDSFAASSGEGEQLGESGESGGMSGIEFECFAPGGFGWTEECEAFVEDISSLEGSRESVAGVFRDSEEQICCGPILFECQLAAGGDPEGFGVVGELSEDFVCCVE
jgi:hypothetical protein